MPSPLGLMNIWYKDPDNFMWYLSDRNMLTAQYPPDTIGGTPGKGGYCCSAISGIEGMPVQMQTIPMLDGISLPLSYLPQAGTIGLAVIVTRPATDSQADYYKLLDKVVRAFYNRRNSVPVPGTLYIQRPGSPRPRQIQVYTVSGLNTPEVGINDITVYSFALSTPDPYWSDDGAEPLSFPQMFGNAGIQFINPASPPAAGKPPFGIAFPPNPPGTPVLPATPGIQFNSSDVAGVFSMPNGGDAYAYPQWVITGPGTPTVTNNTSGRSWSLNTPIPAGQQIQLVTGPGAQNCINITTGANCWGQLVFAGPHNLWPLLSGENSVTVTMPGATSQTAVDVAYTNRYNRA